MVGAPTLQSPVTIMKALLVLVTALISLILPAAGAEVSATFTSATTVPVTAAGYTATGNTVNLALGFAPPVGTDLTVVNNTGPDSIQGFFDNLTHGQRVKLNIGGRSYSFVANYFGGTGNDLVLQWAHTRVLGWGINSSGQLGIGTITTNHPVPIAVDASGVLAGKTVIATASSQSGSLALCADGTLATWGGTSGGTSSIPILVNSTGVLAGKLPIAITAGEGHFLVLCADGTLAAWGSNTHGQLGNDSTTASSLPVAVNINILGGKKVVAIAAGGNHNLVLCADGTLAAWGNNNYGKLGDGTTTRRLSPVFVNASGVLAGNLVTSVAAGSEHSLALCSNGTIAAWGRNHAGQLGDSSTTTSNVPVLVDATGVLSGKTVIAVDAGQNHNLALCGDGSIAAWGENNGGQLGNDSTTQSSVPVAVNRTGVLLGKTVTSVVSGLRHNLALCADGTLAAWGQNSFSQLGNSSTTQSNVPVLVDATALGTGERFAAVDSGALAFHNFARVASPPPPAATTIAASAITDTGAVLNGRINANGTSTAVSFQYGLTLAYGNTVTASPATVTGTTLTAASATLGSLSPDTTYHYRIVATSGGGPTFGEDRTFSTTGSASLTGLALSEGALSPAFAGPTTSYVTTLPNAVSSVTVTPVAAHPSAAVQVNGITVTSGTASGPIVLADGNNSITVVVTAAGGATSKTYTVTAIRQPAAFTFNSATDVPVTAANFAAMGDIAPTVLNFAPPAGTSLMLVNNTGGALIQGRFSNLPQGRRVNLTFGNTTYVFVANYYGGSGNDLVLQWANTRAMAWGLNSTGQLGNGNLNSASLPTAVTASGVLAGRTITAVAAGESHSLALCSDGRLAAWGKNTNGQLGDGTLLDRSRPVEVDRTGVLQGKKVVAIAAGSNFNLVWCEDGTLVTWGSNTIGQLGNGSLADSSLPVRVNTTGVLLGKTVTAIACGGVHSLVLCSDGTLAAWGGGHFGGLGDGARTNRSLPVRVTMTGVLVGKTVTAVAAGGLHSLARCADGTLAAWGYNEYGQLGDNSTTLRAVPVLVNQAGALTGRRVTAIAAGQFHSLALCDDNTAASWGQNNMGQLGNNSTTQSTVPVAVIQTGALAGKTLAGLAAGNAHSLALCTDGTLASWGSNSNGQLGTSSGGNSTVPVAVSMNSLRSGERFIAGVACMTGFHTLGLVGSPLQTATTLAASGVTGNGAVLNGQVTANGNASTLSFEYGPDETYGTLAAGSPPSVAATGSTATSATLSGLVSGTTYHFRVIATSFGGVVKGADMTFTPNFPPTFPGYAVATSYQQPATIALAKLLAKASDPDGDALTVTSVGPASAQGGIAILQGGSILYTPPAGFSGTDSFPVTISDALAATVIGTVTVTVGPGAGAGGVGANPPLLTVLPGGKMGVVFQGIPGRSYILQRSASGLDNWITLATLTADASGKVSYTDENPPPGSAFYRLGMP